MKPMWLSEADTVKKAESAMACLKSKMNKSQDGLGQAGSVETRARSLSRAGPGVQLDFRMFSLPQKDRKATSEFFSMHC